MIPGDLFNADELLGKLKIEEADVHCSVDGEVIPIASFSLGISTDGEKRRVHIRIITKAGPYFNALDGQVQIGKN